MKKMLLLCTGLFLAAGIASAQVTSDNIVGYQKHLGNAGTYTLLAPNFVNVLPVDEFIELNRISGKFSEGDEVQFYGSDGNSDYTLFWRTAAANYDMIPDGWYTGSYGDAGKTPIKVGTSLFVYTRSTTDIYISGQVEFDDTEFDVTSGFTAVGNCSLFPLDLDEFIFTGLQEGDEVQFYGADGNSDYTLFWRTAAANYDMIPDGWYTGIYGDAGDTNIKPGEGFFLNAKGSTVRVKIPSSLN